MARRITNLTRQALGRDLTNAGERIDIYYGRQVDFKKFNIYQKSHYRRYEFACKLLNSDMLVGDLACGTGYGTVMMSHFANHAYGCDISPILQSVKKRYAKFDRVSFLQSDILLVRGIPILNAIVSFETVEHLPDQLVGKLFEKFKSMLCDGGLLVFSTPFRQPATPASKKHHRVFEIDEVKATYWANEAGFQVQNFFYQNYENNEIKATEEPKDFMICVCLKKCLA